MNLKTVKVIMATRLIDSIRNGSCLDLDKAAAVFCTDEMVLDPVIENLPHCCVQFTDTEDPRDQRAFTKMQANTIRDFIFNLPDTITTLYCCCDWGGSRSPGLAAACMVYLHQNHFVLFEGEDYLPNLLVYSYMCEALGCGLPSRDELDALLELRYRLS